MDVGSYIMGKPKQTTKKRKKQLEPRQLEEVTKFAVDVAKLNVATVATLGVAQTLKQVVET